MVDTKKIFILALRKALKEAFHPFYIGAYPHNVEKATASINQNNPAFLIEDGNERRIDGTNHNLWRNWDVYICIYSNVMKTQQTELTRIQTEIETIVLSSAFRKTLGETVVCVEYLNCDKGGYNTGWDGLTTGYNGNSSLRKINLNIKYSTVRG